MTVAKCRAVLVEKVAKALFETPPKGLERWELWCDADHLVREEYREYARAALAVALEEAAKVCERRFMGDLNREDMEARRCAAAIRAMIPKEDK
ncbi:MAG: hypothetical protein RLZZ555_2338, partial [Pseudomonadota bacterium]|jgi:hypothetical protein